MMELVRVQVKAGAAAGDIENKCAEIEGLKAQLRLHEQEQARSQGENDRLAEMLDELGGESLDLSAYDDALVRRQVEGIKVASSEKIVVRFSFGVEVEEEIR